MLLYIFKGEDNRNHLQMMCPKGHEYTIRRLSVFTTQGQRCKQCFIESRTISYEEQKEMFEKNGAKLLTPKSEYQNNHSKIRYVCEVCKRQHSGTFKSYKKGTRSCTREKLRGENHPAWNHDLTPEERDRRRDYKHIHWSQAVIERDNYTCQKCNCQGTMHAHHIRPYRYFKEFRTNMDNGVSLCKHCHNVFHGLFGRVYDNPDSIDWDEQWRYFQEEYTIPPKVKKERVHFGEHFPEFTYVPQRIFERNEVLVSTIPFAEGYYIEQTGQVYGRFKKHMSKGASSIAFNNYKTKIRFYRRQLAQNLFSMKLTPKDDYNEHWYYSTYTNKRTNLEGAFKLEGITEDDYEIQLKLYGTKN